MEITLEVNKNVVMNEVKQEAEFVAAKQEGDENAYERIRIVNEDEVELNRFWDQSKAALVLEMTQYCLYISDSMTSLTFALKLDVSDKFNTTMLPSLNVMMKNYFVKSILSKWYGYTNKAEALPYAESAVSFLQALKDFAMYKKKCFERKLNPF